MSLARYSYTAAGMLPAATTAAKSARELNPRVHSNIVGVSRAAVRSSFGGTGMASVTARFA